MVFKSQRNDYNCIWQLYTLKTKHEKNVIAKHQDLTFCNDISTNFIKIPSQIFFEVWVFETDINVAIKLNEGHYIINIKML